MMPGLSHAAGSTDALLSRVLESYKEDFSGKVYVDTYDDSDVLMEAFGITQELKRENKQYWGRQLGMCWQRLVVELCEHKCEEYGPALKYGTDEPCDLVLGRDAIDTKYRVGSGDSGTLKKFRQYGQLLQDHGYNPILLFVRENNLPAALKSCDAGGWTIFTGGDTFGYLEEKTGFDLHAWLIHHTNERTFFIDRTEARE